MRMLIPSFFSRRKEQNLSKLEYFQVPLMIWKTKELQWLTLKIQEVY